jgi:hypothetical protein
VDMSEREELERELRESLTIERGRGGKWRYVMYGPIAVGRLRKDESSGRYVLEWLADWRPTLSELEAADFEHAEGWAVKEIASLFAISAQARSLHG